MDRANIAVNAGKHFNSGFNCAESVLLSLAEAYNKDKEIQKFASFFGGGIGSTHQEICGALSGAVLFIGHLLGRTDPKKNIDNNKELIKEILSSFNKTYNTTNCGKLTDGLDRKSQSEKCEGIVKYVAELTFEKLKDKIDLS